MKLGIVFSVIVLSVVSVASADTMEHTVGLDLAYDGSGTFTVTDTGATQVSIDGGAFVDATYSLVADTNTGAGSISENLVAGGTVWDSSTLISYSVTSTDLDFTFLQATDGLLPAGQDFTVQITPASGTFDLVDGAFSGLQVENAAPTPLPKSALGGFALLGLLGLRKFRKYFAVV